MGKNSNKPVHKSQIARGGGGADADEEQKPFHSKEYEQAQLESLLAGSQRPTWEEFKEQQRKRGELEGAEDRLEEEAQRRFRVELDEARNARLGAAEKSSEKKHKHKHKKDKEKKKHSKRERSGESDSDSEGEARKKKKKKKHRSEKKDKESKEGREGHGHGSKADGPVSLRAFFAEGSSSDDD